jgi:uncharacterized membrane protein
MGTEIELWGLPPGGHRSKYARSKFNPERRALILAAASKDLPKEMCAVAGGIGRDILWKWLDRGEKELHEYFDSEEEAPLTEYAQFYVDFHRAPILRLQRASGVLEDAMDRKDESGRPDKLAVDVARFFLERKGGFIKKTEQSHTGQVAIGPIPIVDSIEVVRPKSVSVGVSKDIYVDDIIDLEPLPPSPNLPDDNVDTE